LAGPYARKVRDDSTWSAEAVCTVGGDSQSQANPNELSQIKPNQAKSSRKKIQNEHLTIRPEKCSWFGGLRPRVIWVAGGGRGVTMPIHY
jgi:hypothetical protein